MRKAGEHVLDAADSRGGGAAVTERRVGYTYYTYDVSGRLTSKTDWNQVDSQGNGILDRDRSVTRYVYDAQGLLRQQIATRGADHNIAQTTSYSYDGLGRLIGQTDALGHVTTYA